MRASNKKSPSQMGRRRAIAGAMRSMRGWREMVIIDETAKEPSVVARVPTWRFALLVFAIAGALTLYIGHIYKSQDLLDVLQAERRENLRLYLHYNSLLGQYNEATGPGVIYERAPETGLGEGYDYEGIIRPVVNPTVP